MKIISVLLTLIVVSLLLIFLKLGQMQSAFEASGQNTQSVVASNSALIAQMQKLENSFDSFRKEIADFREQMLKR